MVRLMRSGPPRPCGEGRKTTPSTRTGIRFFDQPLLVASAEARDLLPDPCRLVRQVKESGSALGHPLATKLLHLPDKPAGVADNGAATGLAVAGGPPATEFSEMLPGRPGNNSCVTDGHPCR